jgi:hypothetical protein
MKNIEWMRGLNRVFILGWAIWVLFVFLWIPLQSIHGWQELAKAQYAFMYSIDSPPSAEEKAELESRANEYWSKASWSYVYQTEVLPEIWYYIGAALLVPPFVYGLLRAFIALSVWLYRGFVAP